MIVSYDEFTAAFLAKISEFEFARLCPENRQNIVDGYMKRSCAKFSEVCKFDIAAGDDEAREFTFSDDATESEIDEILEIVSEGMVVQWLKPMIYKQENLELALNMTDFTSYSPAELTKQVKAVYTDARENYTNMVNEYSYRHGDLTDLHL